MARVKGGLFTATLDVNKRFPLDSRELVAKREDLINPKTWITNTLATESTYNVMIVSVNSDGEHNGVYYLIDRKAITAENYSAYHTALNAGLDVSSYFSMWMKLGTLADLAAIEHRLKELIGEVPNGKTITDMIRDIKPSMNLVPINGTMIVATTEDGDKAIGVAVAPVANNALTAVDGGLFVPTYVEGDGIQIESNKISVKLASVTHGLVAVNGALSLQLATEYSDGAMSKEDKILLAELKDSVSLLNEAHSWGEI